MRRPLFKRLIERHRFPERRGPPGQDHGRHGLGVWPGRRGQALGRRRGQQASGQRGLGIPERIDHEIVCARSLGCGVCGDSLGDGRRRRLGAQLLARGHLRWRRGYGGRRLSW
ncbi:hypothetical protein C8263_13770 [Deinococcus arcticus]|uniref:Uncharacterized protein n=1 Tax=Deinococcus arcticus TaxID=2136176 RepID=A0A2T3W5X7_9DEIO|nr:hypothetical protein C8263_13770 [Deinococcus arcticus]